MEYRFQHLGRPTVSGARVLVWLLLWLPLTCAIASDPAVERAARLPAPAGWPWPDRFRDVTGTWLDAFNFMDLVPGPPFLLLYPAAAALLLLALRGLQTVLLMVVEPTSALDREGRLRAADKLNYQEVAFLRGGRPALVETAVANLYRLRCIDTDLRPASGPAPAGLDALEKAVLHATAHAHDADALQANATVARALTSWERDAQPRLRRLGLLPGSATWFLVAVFALAGLLLVTGLGGIRLARSKLRGYHNVGLLTIETALLALAAPPVFLRRQSRAARRHLRTLRRESQVTRQSVRARLISQADPQLLYAVAAGGAASVGGSYALLHHQLRPPRESGGWCSGGGCGGGGCGGGGCGGGGCGGG